MNGLWWWLFFSGAFGAIVGSFLGVVIYRVPNGLSVRIPKRSFCPWCDVQIGWYDNLPLLSYVLLGGRCRNCRAGIPLRYPVVEFITIALFLFVFDAFFVTRVRDAIETPFGILTSGVAEHWPILLAHWILIGTLIAVAATDIQAYWLDIRMTSLAAIAGLLLHAIWTPESSREWFRPGPILAAAVIAMALTRVIVWWFFDRRHPLYHEDSFEDQIDHLASEIEIVDLDLPLRVVPPKPLPTPHSDLAAPLSAVLVVAAFGLAAWIWFDGQGHKPGDLGDPVGLAFIARSVLVFGAAFGIMLAASMAPRDADDHIAEIIHDERPMARPLAWRELLRLAPSILAGAAVILVLAASPRLREQWSSLLHWRPLDGMGRPVMEWRPIWGFSAALTGLVLAAGFGWGVRIVFTLGLGREALGFGDVHILVAAGAVVGTGAAIWGFFAASFVALLAIVLMWPVKRSRIIPFGPALGLGILMMVVAEPAVTRWFEPVIFQLHRMLDNMVIQS